MLHDVEKKYRDDKHDLIAQYTHTGSQAFAPLTRLGVFPDRGAERFNVKSPFIETFKGTYWLILLRGMVDSEDS